MDEKGQSAAGAGMRNEAWNGNGLAVDLRQDCQECQEIRSLLNSTRGMCIKLQ